MLQKLGQIGNCHFWVTVLKTNYRSNMLPLSLLCNALLKYNEAASNSLWAGKKKRKTPNINLTKLYAAVEDGGLNLLPRIAW